MKVTDFQQMADAFIEQVHTIVWCNVATVDTKERPRSRVLHPIWEIVEGKPVGYIATGRHTLKTKHVEKRPFLSLAYIANPIKPVYADCHVQWDDTPETKQRIWDWFGREPQPLGYDLSMFFGTVDNPNYGVMVLTPWRIELADLMGESQTWYS